MLDTTHSVRASNAPDPKRGNEWQDKAMTSFISHTTIDCHDAFALSEWWKRLLGYVDIEGDPNAPGHEECMIQDPGSGHRLLFIEVPDESLPPKRIHFDVRPRNGTQAAEIERVLNLGAALIADRRGIYGPGSGWAVLADPEGNQFCVLRSEVELREAREAVPANTASRA